MVDYLLYLVIPGYVSVNIETYSYDLVAGCIGSVILLSVLTILSRIGFIGVLIRHLFNIFNNGNY